MRFGRTLRRSIYEPWAEHYLDYDKLKALLREHEDASSDEGKSPKDESSWTDEDEGAFVEELVNVQLEKVHDFQVQKSQELRERTTRCESRLDELVQATGGDGHGSHQSPDAQAQRQTTLKEVLEELDGITKEVNELEKYSRINFTGFLKAAKKHDRKRGKKYRVKPLMQVRLGALPFNSENYSPLLYRLSAMYAFVRQQLDDSKGRSWSGSDVQLEGVNHVSYKYWVHRDNIMEVKTYILRRLPVLVYNPQSANTDAIQDDPKITSLYFDNVKFSLYAQKIDKTSGASSLRLRWYGKLTDKPEIFLERKTILEGDRSEETRISIKEKYIQPFITGTYKMEKSVQKMQDQQRQSREEIEQYQGKVDELQQFILQNELQPMLRANYTRTAFQIPGDDRIRVSLDTDLVLMREDCLNAERPCRAPQSWHRTDIDEAEIQYPFDGIPAAERSRFPFALLEIRFRDDGRRRIPEWVSDLTSSHLVKETARFSKFVHGVAVLFEDQVNSLPFWISDLDKDIRKDPATAFEEEQEKAAIRADDEVAVGSFLGAKASPRFPSSGLSSPRPRPGRSLQRDTKPALVAQTKLDLPESDDEDDNADKARRRMRGTPDRRDHQPQPQQQEQPQQPATDSLFRNIRSLLPRFSRSAFARARNYGTMELPPGVRAPGELIKDSGPVKVEPKVWLANERTFVRWQHIAVLLGSLSLGLYNAATATAAAGDGHGSDGARGRAGAGIGVGVGAGNPSLARSLAIVYICLAVFAGLWGWWVYIRRGKMIAQRSGKEFDNVLGPVVVCLGLLVAVVVNFFLRLRYRSTTTSSAGDDNSGSRTLPSMIIPTGT